MQLKPMTINLDDFPDELHPYLDGARLYDSSCSENAKVIFIDKDNGYFLKAAAITDLDREYELTSYFHSKGLAAKVVSYAVEMGYDYLLTEKVPGDDCIADRYLDHPERLAEMLGEQLAHLHSAEHSDYNLPPHTPQYLSSAENGFLQRRFQTSLFPDHWRFASPEEAYAVIEENKADCVKTPLTHSEKPRKMV